MVNIDPDFGPAYCDRGEAWLHLSEWDNVITDCSTAIRLHPEYVDAYHVRGLAHARKGNHRASIADFTEVVNIDPDFGPAYCDRGEAWLHLSEWDNVRADLAIAEDMGVNVVASFHNDYEDVADFEQHTGITLPDDVADMLGG